MSTKSYLMAIAVVSCAAFGSSAHAEEGAVKVDCGNCDTVSLGQICDTFIAGSQPIALACENTATPGSGILKNCGSSGTTCRPFFGLTRGDLLGSYCFGNGSGNDAVVTCDTTPEP